LDNHAGVLFRCSAMTTTVEDNREVLEAVLKEAVDLVHIFFSKFVKLCKGKWSEIVFKFPGKCAN